MAATQGLWDVTQFPRHLSHLFETDDGTGDVAMVHLNTPLCITFYLGCMVLGVGFGVKGEGRRV